MRIGTWNLDNKWTHGHKDLLNGQQCDIWLLTEVHRGAENPKGRIAHFNCHLSSGVMTLNQHWAGVLSRKELAPLDDPHDASAAAHINGITYCSSVLPWAVCRKYPPFPWIGDTLVDMTNEIINTLTNRLRNHELVWGGDWNQNLTGGWEFVGSKERATLLESAIRSFDLQLTTRDLPHQSNNGTHTIDHIAIPSKWKVVRKPVRVSALGLSDHDAYIVEVERE